MEIVSELKKYFPEKKLTNELSFKRNHVLYFAIHGINQELVLAEVPFFLPGAAQVCPYTPLIKNVLSELPNITEAVFI